MALTTCPECNNSVSTEAKTCPHCGYPLKKDGGKAVFKIAEKWGLQVQTIKSTCDIIDTDTGNVLASPKMGEIAAIDVPKEMTVKLCLHGYFGEPTVDLFPDETVYINVAISGLGKIYCQSSSTQNRKRHIVKTISCPQCHFDITDDLEECPYCGYIL
ncbi:MAG: zinc ribbon domain-containing protein [Candidatus Fimimonas sp.]